MVIHRIRRLQPGCSIEVLIPDFKGSLEALKIVMDARPEILNHNPGLRVLCDPAGRVAKAYGAFVNLGFLRFAKKLIVLVDAYGRVERVWSDPVGPENVDELLGVLGAGPR